MDATMLGKAVQKLVVIPDDASGITNDLLEKLGGREHKKWQEVFKMLTRVSPEEIVKLLFNATKNLLVNMMFWIEVEEIVLFVPKDNFVVGEKDFYHFTPKFEKLIELYVVDNAKKSILIVYQLQKKCDDNLILQTLGSMKEVSITPGQLFRVISDKRFKDGCDYFAYIKDIGFAVHFCWIENKGWYFDACEVNYNSQKQWPDTYRLIIRNPYLT